MAAGAFHTDVEALRVAINHERSAEALAIWRGPFLGRFRIRGAPEWEQWVDERRMMLEASMGGLMRRAAVRERERGSFTGAAHFLEAAAWIQPFEVDHRFALIDAFLAAGALKAATAELSELRERAGDVVSAARLNACAELVERAWAARRCTHMRDLADPSLAGRSGEIAALRRLWDSAAAEHPAAGVITGQSGAGATRLLTEASSIVEQARGRVVRLDATPASSWLRWGAVAQLVRAMSALPGAAGISPASDRILSRLFPSRSRGVENSALLRTLEPVLLVDAIHDLIEAVTYESPLLIGIDDLEYIDEPSRYLLANIGHRLKDVPLLLLVTVCSPPYDAALHSALETIRTWETCRTLEPRAFTIDEIRQVIEGEMPELDGTQLRSLATTVHGATDGVAGEVTRLLEAWRSSGVIALDPSAGWVFTVPPRIPAGFRDGRPSAKRATVPAAPRAGTRDDSVRERPSHRPTGTTDDRSVTRRSNDNGTDGDAPKRRWQGRSLVSRIGGWFGVLALMLASGRTVPDRLRSEPTPHPPAQIAISLAAPDNVLPPR